jgi:hypothetical protein
MGTMAKDARQGLGARLTLASAALLVGLLADLADAVAAPLPPPTGAAPCWRSIRLFDQIVVSRFDNRLLAIEAYELAEAEGWRSQAEADCARGDFAFGLASIEAALEMIGVSPEPGLDQLLDW